MKSDEKNIAIKELREMKKEVRKTINWMKGPGSFKDKSKKKKPKSRSSSSNKKKKTKSALKKSKSKSSSTSSNKKKKTKSKLTKPVRTVTKQQLQRRNNRIKAQFEKLFPNEDFNKIHNLWRSLSTKTRENARNLEMKSNPTKNPYLIESNAMKNWFNQEYSRPARARVLPPLVRQQAVKGDEPPSHSRLN